MLLLLLLLLQVGQRHGLPLLSPVDDAGLFTAEAGALQGLAVQVGLNYIKFRLYLIGLNSDADCSPVRATITERPPTPHPTYLHSTT